MKSRILSVSALLCLSIILTGAHAASAWQIQPLEFSGVETRYLRVVNPHGVVGVPEMVVYGTPVSATTCP